MDQTEKLIIDIIDQHRDEIIEFARDIYTHAELGYKEFRTSQKFVNKMKELGLHTETGFAITGVKAYLNEEKKENASLALLGELDALRIPEHAYVNSETDAAHCCGHHAQMAGIFGAALALTVPEIAEKLGGQVVFFATPAEEYGEIEFKNQLREQGKIRYGGGKCELIRTGAFDDIDLCLAHHIQPGDEIQVGSGTGNGFVSKVIRYLGKAAHAAGAPDKGVNALSAASLGLQALGLNRETFRDEDCVRVLPHADVKVYLTASVETRAKRRYQELQEKGEDCNLEEIAHDIEERDRRDMTREIAPLKQAEDAVLVDSSDMTITEVVKTIVDLCR